MARNQCEAVEEDIYVNAFDVVQYCEAKLPYTLFEAPCLQAGFDATRSMKHT